MPHDDPSLDDRVRCLERRYRRLSALSVLLGAVLVAAFAQRPAQVSDVVQARRFQVVDAAGRVRIDLRHDSTETGLFVLDQAGDTRVGAVQFAHGGGGVALHGPRLKGAAVLYLKGSGSLTFYDTAGGVVHRVPGEGDTP
jgi:hypothetical protein